MFVLYRNTGVHSGRALRTMLADLYDERVRGGYPKKLEAMLKTRRTPQIVVNLGVTDDLAYDGKMLNTQDMVRAASNKKAARKLFAENDIPAPELYLKTSQISTDDLPVVGRTSYHKKGEGFWFCKSLSQVKRASAQGATHFLQFIPKTREYRVHTFIKRKYWETEEREPKHYASIKISEKVWQGEGFPNLSEPQKNHQFGWVFQGAQDRREDELDVVRHTAKRAIAALGLDFGAVDVMYRVGAKQPLVLEVNSTPSLSDENATTCEVYAHRILKTISSAKEK